MRRRSSGGFALVGGRRLKPVQERRCPLRMRCGLEYRSLVAGENRYPRRQVARVVLARLEFRRDAEVGAEEAAPEFGNQFLTRTLGLVFGVAAEVAIEPAWPSRPVNIMPISA